LRRLAALAYAWGAGAVFVTSLLYLLYFYFLQLDRPRTEPVFPAAAFLIDLSLFALFALHHSVMARVSAKAWFARRSAPELERATFVWVASLIFIVVCAAWRHVPGDLYRADPPLRWILLAVQLTGIVVVVESAARLDVLDLAGVRQVQAAEGMHAPAATPLQITGGYRLVRHPIYFGWVLMVFGSPHMTMDRLAFAAISTAYLMIGTVFEERGLEREFGESYREYKRKVRWRFIPGLY
jgi:protein-S-isoprenylcysteine O-methyltransferase Ste14